MHQSDSNHHALARAITDPLHASGFGPCWSIPPRPSVVIRHEPRLKYHPSIAFGDLERIHLACSKVCTHTLQTLVCMTSARCHTTVQKGHAPFSRRAVPNLSPQPLHALSGTVNASDESQQSARSIVDQLPLQISLWHGMPTICPL